MKKVYITKSNFKRIISTIDLSTVPDNILECHLHENIDFDYLNKSYKKKLLAYMHFIQNAEQIDMYEKVAIVKDTFTYLVEKETKPSYHSDINCKRMISRFENLVVPKEIQALGETKVIEFRDYVKSEFGEYNPEKFKERADLIKTKLNFKFGVCINNLDFVSEDFTGSQIQVNPKLEDLEKEFKAILDKFNDACRRNTPIFPAYAQRSFLWHKPKEIKRYPSMWYTKEEFINILKEFDLLIVERTAELLREYYRVKFNKDLSFNGLLLQQLNFKPCEACKDYKTPV